MTFQQLCCHSNWACSPEWPVWPGKCSEENRAQDHWAWWGITRQSCNHTLMLLGSNIETQVQYYIEMSEFMLISNTPWTVEVVVVDLHQMENEFRG